MLRKTRGHLDTEDLPRDTLSVKYTYELNIEARDLGEYNPSIYRYFLQCHTFPLFPRI